MKTIVFSLLLILGVQGSVAKAEIEVTRQTATKVQRFFKKLFESGNSGSFADAVGSVGTPTYAGTLPSHAKNRYLNLYKNWSDYPPKAFNVLKNDSNLPMDLIVITEDTDGGSYIYVFTAEGDVIAEGSQGESGDFRW